MNKITTLLTALLLVLLFSYSAKAGSLPEILDLPQTFGPSLLEGSIDMDNDGIADFYVFFEYDDYGTSGSSFYYYCEIYGVDERNCVISEGSQQDRSSGTYSPALARPVRSWVNILPYGTRIEQTPPVGSYWSYGDYIARGDVGVNTALNASFLDTPNGYIGVQFYTDDELYFGWIQVSVNTSAPSVTLGEPHAYASTPGSPILAGAGGVVPVPIIASVFGFLAIGAGLYFRRKRKK